jgi:O-antigen chain-terminating methyltransferase
MESSQDLKRVLAEEVRAAIAETAPSGLPAAGRGDPSSAEARSALSRAEEVLTPAVPDGAPLSAAKRLAIRAFRFLWRNQSAFNSLSLSASAGLAESLDRLRAESTRGIDELSRRAGIQESRLTLAEASAGLAPLPSAASPAPAAVPAIPAGVYALFEERFRGSPEEIARNQRFYLDFVRGLPGPVLDVGCGRGEFLGLLRAAGIPASGVESNPLSVAACRQAGLEVEEGDVFALLGKRPAAKLGGVVAFQVVEHWSPEAIFRFLQQARRVLAPSGVLIAETINADSLSALRAFYLDPTHVRPVPAEGLRFLAEAAGFADIRIEYRSPLPAAERLEERSPNEQRLNALLFGPQDYALIGRAPASA